MENLPYVAVTGTLESLLDKIKSASVPDKFSQDFVATKLLIKGGAGRALIPFVKRMGLVTSDGNPTARYKELRNPDKSKFAIANSMREIYAPLFEMNEKVYDLDSSKLKGLIVEATGAEANSAVVQKTLSTFQALRKRADFSENNVAQEEVTSREAIESPILQISNGGSSVRNDAPAVGESINLSYTINLNLPATSDIEVFNAIFKSIKQHLIQG